MAIASLVLGICAIVFSFLPGLGFLGLVLAIIGLVLGVLGRKREPERSGMATAGMVLSIIALVLFVIVVLIVGLLIGAALSFL